MITPSRNLGIEGAWVRAKPQDEGLTKMKSAALQGHRVLVVEDEYYLADDLKRVLDRLGAQVLGPVATQEEALAHLAGPGRVDLAVLDINLRGEMAFPTADALADRGVPFVFATGYDVSALPPRHRDVAIVQKPFEPEALVRALPLLSPPD